MRIENIGAAKFTDCHPRPALPVQCGHRPALPVQCGRRTPAGAASTVRTPAGAASTVWTPADRHLVVLCDSLLVTSDCVVHTQDYFTNSAYCVYLGAICA